MFAGRFGYSKNEIINNNSYQVGDTRVEVYFSPQEDAMGRILEGSEYQGNHQFFIFAFTKDQLGLLIEKDREFKRSMCVVIQTMVMRTTLFQKANAKR